MKQITILLALCLPGSGQALAQDSEDVWAPLRPFVGNWVGQRTGLGGDAKQSTEIDFVLGDQYLQCTTKTLEGEDPHADMGMISYDKARQKFVYRSFMSEGFVNTYVGSVSEDGKSIEFVTEKVENGPAGLKAREVWSLDGGILKSECFLASGDNPFKSCIVVKMIKQDKACRAGCWKLI